MQPVGPSDTNTDQWLVEILWTILSPLALIVWLAALIGVPLVTLYGLVQFVKWAWE